MSPCYHMKVKDGVNAIVCCSRLKAKKCAICGRPSSRLCDFPITLGVKKPGTCDIPLCEKCAVHRDPDTDYCPTHARIIEEEEEKKLAQRLRGQAAEEEVNAAIEAADHDESEDEPDFTKGSEEEVVENL